MLRCIRDTARGILPSCFLHGVGIERSELVGKRSSSSSSSSSSSTEQMDSPHELTLRSQVVTLPSSTRNSMKTLEQMVAELVLASLVAAIVVIISSCEAPSTAKLAVATVVTGIAIATCAGYALTLVAGDMAMLLGPFILDSTPTAAIWLLSLQWSMLRSLASLAIAVFGLIKVAIGPALACAAMIQGALVSNVIQCCAAVVFFFVPAAVLLLLMRYISGSQTQEDQRHDESNQPDVSLSIAARVRLLLRALIGAFLAGRPLAIGQFADLALIAIAGYLMLGDECRGDLNRLLAAKLGFSGSLKPDGHEITRTATTATTTDVGQYVYDDTWLADMMAWHARTLRRSTRNHRAIRQQLAAALQLHALHIRSLARRCRSLERRVAEFERATEVDELDEDDNEDDATSSTSSSSTSSSSSSSDDEDGDSEIVAGDPWLGAHEVHHDEDVQMVVADAHTGAMPQPLASAAAPLSTSSPLAPAPSPPSPALAPSVAVTNPLFDLFGEEDEDDVMDDGSSWVGEMEVEHSQGQADAGHGAARPPSSHSLSPSHSLLNSLPLSLSLSEPAPTLALAPQTVDDPSLPFLFEEEEEEVVEEGEGLAGVEHGSSWVGDIEVAVAQGQADAGHGAARPPSSLSPSHSHSEPPPELAPTPRPGRKRGAVEDCTEGGVKRLRSGQDVASSMTVMFATTSSTVGLVATAASAPLPTPSVAAAAEAAAVSPASNAAGEASSSLALPPPSSPPSSPPPPLLPQLDQVEQHEQEPQPMLPRVRLADDASIRPMLPRSVRRRIEYIAPVSARRHVQARMRVRERSRQRRSNTGDGSYSWAAQWKR